MRMPSIVLHRSRGRGGWLSAPALLLFFLAPTPARAQGAGADTVVLSWTAPGDDGNVGTAASYEIRLSNGPITQANWPSASVVPGAPAPRPAGARQRAVVRGLDRGTTYYFAIKTTDEANNQSALSNVVRWDWATDVSPPGPPSGVTVTLEGARKVRVRWSPNGDPDLAGYTVYRSTDAGGSFVPATSGLITATQYLDSAIPGAAETVSYRVTASDQTGNESAPSGTRSVSFAAQASTSWSLEVGYPNPSRLAAPVNIPVVVPSEGSQGATLQIMDSGGHIVRRFELGGLPAGPQAMVWDGRNEGGRQVAPGVYTAWLIGTGEHRSIKLVRVP